MEGSHLPLQHPRETGDSFTPHRILFVSLESVLICVKFKKKTLSRDTRTWALNARARRVELAVTRRRPGHQPSVLEPGKATLWAFIKVPRDVRLQRQLRSNDVNKGLQRRTKDRTRLTIALLPICPISLGSPTSFMNARCLKSEAILVTVGPRPVTAFATRESTFLVLQQRESLSYLHGVR